MNQTTDKKNSTRRITRGFIIVLFAVTIILTILINFLLNNYVKNKIIDSVEKSSRGLYHVKIGSLRAKFWSGAVHMTDVRLYQDSVLFAYIQRTDTGAHLSHIDVNFDAIDISSIKWRNYIHSNNLQVGKVDLHGPHFYMHSESLESKPEDSDKNFLDLLPGLIASFAGSLKIRELNVITGDLRFDLKYKEGITKQTSDHINLSLNEIEIDTFSRQKAIFTNDAILSFSNYVLVTPHNNYTFKIKNGYGKLSDSILTLTNLDFKKQSDSLGKKTMMNISIKGIEGSGLNFQTLIRDKKIEVRKLKLNSPDITIKTPHNSQKSDTTDNNLPSLIPAFTKKFVDSVKIDTILLSDGRIKTNIESKAGHFIIQNAERIKIEFVRLPTDLNQLSKKELVIANLHNYQLEVTSLNLKMDIEQIKISTDSRDMNLKNVSMTQMHSYGPKQRYYFKNQIKNVYASGLDFPSMFQSRKLMMNKLRFDDLNLKIYLDERKSEKTKNHNMPQKLMNKIRFPIDVKELEFFNANIFYVDQEPDLKPAQLTFTNSRITMKNFTNDRKKMTDKTPIVAKGTTLVMGQGLIDFTLKVPLLSKTFDCTYDGTVGKMDGSLFNDFMAMAALKVDRGQIETSKFNVNITNGNANGDIEFIYHGLNIKAIDKNTGDVKRKDSWLVNFAVKDANPNKRHRDPERVNVQTAIKGDEGFFYFLWKVLRIGAVETMTKSSVFKQGD